MELADRSGYSPCKTRSPSSYGYFPYDANVLGGLLIGTGMTLTGACPGTVLTQISAGVRSGLFVGIGALLGGVLYTKFAPYLRRAPQHPAQITPQTGETHTVQSKLGLSTSSVLLAYEAMCLSMIYLTQRFAPQGQTSLSPILGGMVIGAAQASTVLMTRRTVGVSTAYQDLGRRFWKAVNPSANFPSAKLVTPAVTFASGILAGTYLLANSGYVHVPLESMQISEASAIAGGAAMVFGAGLAGGCPSGHGISGMATFSLSSFVSVAAMFGGGIAAALLFG